MKNAIKLQVCNNPKGYDPRVKDKLTRILMTCRVEIEADSFFNGNIQACDFAYWLNYSGYLVGGIPVKKCSIIDALSFMKDWAEEN